MHDDDITVRSLILRVNDVEVVCVDGCYTLRTIPGEDDETLWDKVDVTAESFKELERVTRMILVEPALSETLRLMQRIEAVWVDWHREHKESNKLSSLLD